MPKNYYLILGIPSSSSQEDIKAAYRRMVKEFHPDRYGQKHSPFLTIQEAYSVLGDPVQRRTYDKNLQEKQRTQPNQRYVEPTKSYRRSTVEPLIPEQESPRRVNTSLARSFFSPMHSLESLFDPLFSAINEGIGHRDETKKELTVTIALTPEQASSGGHLRLQVPVLLRCAECNGQGSIGPYECWRCSGAGLLRGKCPVIISYPPGITDNSFIRLSLDRYGVEGEYVTVYVRI